MTALPKGSIKGAQRSNAKSGILRRSHTLHVSDVSFGKRYKRLSHLSWQYVVYRFLSREVDADPLLPMPLELRGVGDIPRHIVKTKTSTENGQLRPAHRDKIA
ncbi:hypothetical protein ALP68_02515 [Pseudomonas ficuserectae]|nr:hypothetical protein ALP68_02515 [Pseudomonas ficuserectae]RMS40613.1 hypothetical protein ALP67_00540 [Pseudomonas ficuserectae]